MTINEKIDALQCAYKLAAEEVLTYAGEADVVEAIYSTLNLDSDNEPTRDDYLDLTTETLNGLFEVVKTTMILEIRNNDEIGPRLTRRIAQLFGLHIKIILS